MPINVDRSLRLPDGEYFSGHFEKTGICIHHTVGGSAKSTFNWWMRDNQMVGTAYIIERDGTIFEVFDPSSWAWQFGLNWDYEDKIAFEKRFIGIEIASEGGLIEHENKLYFFDTVSPRTLKQDKEDVFDFGSNYRGYRYFDKYQEAQIDSLTELINHLCDTYTVPRQFPQNPLTFHGERLKSFNGIIGHTMVRKDKTDPIPDNNLWTTLQTICNAEERKIQEMTDEDIDALFEHNVQEINKMNIAAGSMIKGLIMELQRDNRDTYIKLRDAVPNGHLVNYDFVKGDPNLVFRIGNALGLKKVTNDTLEVRNA